MKHSSRRLKSSFHQQENFSIDSQIDSLSDNEENQIIKSDNSNENSFSLSSCCLICSILPNLSHINTCSNHLELLHRSSIRPTTQVVYMMNPSISQCSCQRKSKRRYRSISSSSSTESKYRRKKRSLTIQSSSPSSQDEQFFSPILSSQDRSESLNHGRLSPSLPPSTVIQTHRNYPDVLFTSILQQNNLITKELIEETLSDVIEFDSISSLSTHISPNEIVHVKDENESLNDYNQKESLMNMSEATEQMFNHQYPQPIILLERIRLENY